MGLDCTSTPVLSCDFAGLIYYDSAVEVEVCWVAEIEASVNVLDEEAFSFARICEIAKQRRNKVKVFLLDKSALDSFGNAYADEMLFAAGIHLFVRKLGQAELVRRHAKISQVLQDGTTEIKSRAPAADEKLRDFLKV